MLCTCFFYHLYQTCRAGDTWSYFWSLSPFSENCPWANPEGGGGVGGGGGGGGGGGLGGSDPPGKSQVAIGFPKNSGTDPP